MPKRMASFFLLLPLFLRASATMHVSANSMAVVIYKPRTLLGHSTRHNTPDLARTPHIRREGHDAMCVLALVYLECR